MLVSRDCLSQGWLMPRERGRLGCKRILHRPSTQPKAHASSQVLSRTLLRQVPALQAPDPRDQPDSRSPAVICTMRSCARWNPPLSASHCFLFKPRRGSGPRSPPRLRILADPELPHVAPQGIARPRLLGTGRSKPSSDRPGDDQTLSSSGSSSHLSPVEGRCRAPAKRGAGSRF